MQRCTPSVIPTAQIQAPQLEEVDRNRLVTLRGHMKHVDSKIILGVNVCTMVDQQFTHIWIALKRGEVQRCKAITVVLHINPLCNLLLQQVLLYGMVKQHLYALRSVIECTLMNECLSTGVCDLVDAQLWICVKIV